MITRYSSATHLLESGYDIRAMPLRISDMVQWVQSHETILWWLAAVSVITFIATLFIVPLLVVKVPSDYFAHGRRTGMPWADRHVVVRWMLVLVKNLLGYILIAAGILMLVLPGQGILTIVAGMMLLNFPGKYRLERWIVSRYPVLRSINWVRQRAGQVPLVLEGERVRRNNR